VSFRCSGSIVLGAFPALLTVLPAGGSSQSQPNEKLRERAARAGEIVAKLVKEADHAPPQSLLNKATCVAAVPEVAQVGLGIGGKVGFGLASCRTPAGWSLPTFMGLKGGTFGFQIGGQSAVSCWSSSTRTPHASSPHLPSISAARLPSPPDRWGATSRRRPTTSSAPRSTPTRRPKACRRNQPRRHQVGGRLEGEQDGVWRGSGGRRETPARPQRDRRARAGPAVPAEPPEERLSLT
jgi:hypothetical protein